MQTIKVNSNRSALANLIKSTSVMKLNKTMDKPEMISILPHHIHHRNTSDGQLYSRNSATRFLIHTRQEIKVILFDEVVCCVADSNYTKIYLNDGSKVMVSKTLKDFETILYQPNFFRIHASYLINIHFIKRILRSHRCVIELQNDVLLDVSRSRREGLIHKMDTLLHN